MPLRPTCEEVLGDKFPLLDLAPVRYHPPVRAFQYRVGVSGPVVGHGGGFGTSSCRSSHARSRFHLCLNTRRARVVVWSESWLCRATRATRATSFLGRSEILGSCFRFRFSASSDSTQPGQLRARSCHSRPRPDAFASGDPFCATCAHARVSVSEHSVRSPRSCPTGRVIISVPNPAR